MDTRKGFITRFGEWWDERQTYRRQVRTTRPSSHLTAWLPSRGNVIFTLTMIGLLVLGQSVGALPLGRLSSAPAATSTGTIAYQGRLADSVGSPLTGTFNMIFRLYDAATSGTPLWEEQWTGSNGVRVSDGLFNVMLGSLTAMTQDIVAGHDQLFLGITIGTDDEMVPRVQLGSVPFAVQALTVPDESVNTAKLANGAVTSGKLQPTTGQAGITPCCVSLTEDYQDIPGTERTIAVETPSLILINATFDFDFAPPSGGATAVGDVTIDGVRIGRQAIVSGTGIRVTAGTTVQYPLEPGTHSIKLSAMSIGAAPARVAHHTGFTFMVVAR